MKKENQTKAIENILSILAASNEPISRSRLCQAPSIKDLPDLQQLLSMLEANHIVTVHQAVDDSGAMVYLYSLQIGQGETMPHLETEDDIEDSHDSISNEYGHPSVDALSDTSDGDSDSVAGDLSIKDFERASPTSSHRYLPLDRSEKLDLAAKAANGDKLAADKLIRHYLPLVRRIAYSKSPRFKGDVEDLIQVGAAAANKAIRKFDSSKSNNLDVYVIQWVHLEMLRYGVNQRDCIRLPVYMHGVLRTILCSEKRLFEKHGRPPTDKELADDLSIEEEQVREAKEAGRMKSLISLDECLVEAEDEITLKETLPSDEDHPPELSAERWKLSKDVASMLSVLTKKQRYVIERRYGLTGGARMTLDQIADELHVSKTAVHSTQEKALRKLRTNKEVFKIAQDFLGLLTEANSASDRSEAEPKTAAENQE